MFDTPWERRVDDWMVAERLEPEHRAQQQQRRPLTRPGGARRRVLDRVSISPNRRSWRMRRGSSSRKSCEGQRR